MTGGDRLLHVIQQAVYSDNLPGFVIIGAQKAGTRFLQQHLEGHPNVRIGKPVEKEGGSWKRHNEVHYFDRHYDLGLSWYRSHFLKSPLEVLRNAPILFGEKTPDYLCDPNAAARIREVLPDAKMVILLRNPVDRAYSQYRMIVRKGREARSFPDVVHAELDQLRNGVEDWNGCIARGIYAPQIERWFSLFPRESFLVVQSEKMYARPRDIYRDVLTFLDLPEWDPGAFVNGKEREYAKMPPEIHAALSEFYQPHNKALGDLVGAEIDWD